MTRKPDVRDIFQAILNSSANQSRNSPLYKQIVDCGLGEAFESLITQIAGNAANPIMMMFEDAEAGAGAESASESATAPVSVTVNEKTENKQTLPINRRNVDVGFSPKTRTYHR